MLEKLALGLVFGCADSFLRLQVDQVINYKLGRPHNCKSRRAADIDRIFTWILNKLSFHLFRNQFMIDFANLLCLSHFLPLLLLCFGNFNLIMAILVGMCSFRQKINDDSSLSQRI